MRYFLEDLRTHRREEMPEGDLPQYFLAIESLTGLQRPQAERAMATRPILHRLFRFSAEPGETKKAEAMEAGS